MDAITYVFISLLFLKLIWNISVPFVMSRRLALATEKQEVSISISPQLEILLIVLATICSYFSTEQSMIGRSGVVFASGACAIVVSYVLMYVFGFMIGAYGRLKSRASFFDRS